MGMKGFLQEDYNAMRSALYKCMDLFGKHKKRYINKKDYERASKMLKYENLCKDSLQIKDDKDYLCLIVTSRGMTSNINTDNFYSYCGIIEAAILKLKQDKQEKFNELNRREL